MQKDSFLQQYSDTRERNFEAAYIKGNYQYVEQGYVTEKQLYDVIAIIHRANRLVLRSAEKWIFSESALRMHQHFFSQEKQEFPIGNQTWILLEKPIDAPYGNNIQAIYFYPGYPEHEIEKLAVAVKEDMYARALKSTFAIEKDAFILNIIKSDGSYAYSFRYLASKKRWEFIREYKCPTNTCLFEKIDGTLTCLPCQTCLRANEYWVSWFLTARKMVSGEFSPLPEKIEFQKKKELYIVPGKRVVGKGKNKRYVVGDIAQELEYSVITYDISKERKSSALRETIEQEGEKRLNWLKLYDPEDIEYRLKDIAQFERYYTAKNYSRLHERILKEGVLQADGRYKLDDNLYRLSYTPDGEMLVVGTVHHAQRKYVPFLRKDIAKRIVASSEN